MTVDRLLAAALLVEVAPLRPLLPLLPGPAACVEALETLAAGELCEGLTQGQVDGLRARTRQWSAVPEWLRDWYERLVAEEYDRMDPTDRIALRTILHVVLFWDGPPPSWVRGWAARRWEQDHGTPPARELVPSRKL